MKVKEGLVTLALANEVFFKLGSQATMTTSHRRRFTKLNRRTEINNYKRGFVG